MRPRLHGASLLTTLLTRRSLTWIVGCCGWIFGATGCKYIQAPDGSFLGSGLRRRAQRAVLSVKWRRSVNPDHKHTPLTWKLSREESSGVALSPDEELIYVGGEDRFFTCFEADTGKVRWSTRLQGRIVTSPTIHGDSVYIGTTSGLLYAYERYRGKRRWIYRSKGEFLSPVAVQPAQNKRGALVLATSSDNRLNVIRARDGKWQWQIKRDPPAQLTIRGQAPPLFHQGIAYTGFSDGYVVAVRLKDNQTLWTRSLRERERFSDVDAPLVIYGNYLFASSYSGALHALHPKTGATRWKYKIHGASQVQIQDEEVLVSNVEGKVALLSLSTGNVRWQKHFKKAGAFSAPVSNGNHIFLASSELGIYVLQHDNGALVQVLRFGSGFTSTPLLKGHHLYAFSNASFLYSFSTQSIHHTIH